MPVFEELVDLGFVGGKTVPYVAEIASAVLPAPRTFKRTSNRPGRLHLDTRVTLPRP